MRSRRVARVALFAVLALAVAPALWAAGPAPAPAGAQAPAPAVANPATPAPAQALVTPAPQAQIQLQAPTLPVAAGIPGVRTEASLSCAVAYCAEICAPAGGHFGQGPGGCECC